MKLSIYDVLEWIIVKALEIIEARGITDKAKMRKGYERIGRILDKVQGAYVRIGDLLKA